MCRFKKYPKTKDHDLHFYSYGFNKKQTMEFFLNRTELSVNIQRIQEIIQITEA